MGKPKQNPPIRHHFVADSGLQRFGWKGDKKIRIYAKNVRDMTQTIEVSTSKIAKEVDLYTVDTTLQPKDRLLIENFLSQHVEGPTIHVINKIENQESLRFEDKQQLGIYSGFQWVRTPQMRTQYQQMTNDFSDQFAKKLVSLPNIKQSFKEKLKIDDDGLIDAAINLIRDGKVKRRLHNEEHVQFMLDKGLKFGSELAELECFILVAPKRSSFITSDAPFLLLPQEQVTAIGLLVPGVWKTMPISKRFALAFTDKRSRTIGYADITRDGVKIINQQICNHADRFVFGSSDAVLESLAKNRSKSHQAQRTK